MSWALLIVLMTFFYWLLLVVFIKRLRECHQDIWVEIGSPSFIPKSLSENNDGSLLKFIWTMRYMRLGDGELTILGIVIKAYTLTYVMFLAWPFLTSLFRK